MLFAIIYATCCNICYDTYHLIDFRNNYIRLGLFELKVVLQMSNRSPEGSVNADPTHINSTDHDNSPDNHQNGCKSKNHGYSLGCNDAKL